MTIPRACWLSLLLAALLPRSVAARPPGGDVLATIEQRRRAGEIDDETRQLWRVAAVRDPNQLPPDLRARPLVCAPGQATAILFEAFGWLGRHERRGGPLHKMLMPRPDAQYVLDSTRLPIRVTYGQTTDAPFAQQVLAAAEHSWDVEHGEYGFLQPPVEPGKRYYIFVDDIPSGGAYTAPYAYNPATPWQDCLSYIVIDRPDTPDDPKVGIAHEVNHSMQAAADCAEVFNFWESTAAYIMTEVYPDGGKNSGMLEPFFQQKPWQALDHFSGYEDIWFIYGSVLLSIYLTDTYAPSDGPRLMAEIWSAARQPDGSTVNRPTFVDAVGQAVAQRGGPGDFNRIFLDFSESRFFVGVDDDGAHMSAAAGLGGAELTLVADYDATELPLKNIAAPASTRPQPLGSNHVRAELPGTAARVRVSFIGEQGTRWAARAVLFGGASTLARDLPLDSPGGAGDLTLDVAGRRSLLLVVANLGPPGHEVGGTSWPAAGYSFSIEPEGVTAKPPTTVIDPAEVPAGASAWSGCRWSGAGSSPSLALSLLLGALALLWRLRR